MSTEWCRGFGAAPWECRYFPLKALYYSLVHRPAEFLFTFRLLLFSRLFSLSFCLAFVLFLRQGRVFVGSSVVVPPFFPFFSPCLPCPFVFCLFSFSPFFFCIYYEFILAEDLCVHLPLLLISLSFSGGFLVKRFFPFFNFNLCTGCQGVKMYLSPLVGLDIFLVELARTEVSSEETFPSIYQGST